MKTRIIIGNRWDPHWNLAFEEHLVSAAEEEEAILFLWQNRDTVVIGCNQNPWRECDLSAMNRDGVRLARRMTGGGAVFHDEGNLNFSFIVPKERFDVVRQGSVIAGALSEVGIQVLQTGRNDLTVDGRKFSGNAFLHKRRTSLHHGTILIGADMSRLGGYLQVDPAKLAGKGVASVRARVVNLAELVPGLQVEQVKALVRESFSREYGLPDEVEQADFDALPETVSQLAERNASWEWLYGRTAEFTMSVRVRFPWGGLEIGFLNRNARVEEAKVWTDSLLPELAPVLSGMLSGAPFMAEALAMRVRGSRTGNEELDGILSDIADWLAENPL